MNLACVPNASAAECSCITIRLNGMQESEEDENEHYKYGVSAMQGWRTEMVGLLCMPSYWQ